MANIMDPIDDPSYNVEATEHAFGTSASDLRRDVSTYNNDANDTGSGSYGYSENRHPSSITDSIDRRAVGDRYDRTAGISSNTGSYAQGAISPSQKQYLQNTSEQPTQHESPLHQSQYNAPGSAELSYGTNVLRPTVAGFQSSNVESSGPHMDNNFDNINSYNSKELCGQGSQNISPRHQSQQTIPAATESSHGSRAPSSTATEFEPRNTEDNKEPLIKSSYGSSNAHGTGDQYPQHDSFLRQSQTSMSGPAESRHGTEVPASMATASQTSNSRNTTGPRVNSGRDTNADASTTDINKKKGERFEGNQDDDITGEKVNGIAGVIPISGSAGPTTTKTFDPHAELSETSKNVSATASTGNDGEDRKAPARQHNPASSSYNTTRSSDEQSTANSERGSGLGKKSHSGTGVGEVRSAESRSAV
ncbi:hypothetical protein CBS115989_802 [Aspergillus niger]|uniref:Uncharacterized protein n=3 Tax=Aspergillus niger TaxID=5061 RepID=A2QKF4_ASPNC|nr:hypothetical protein An05g00030 [Aspergillus niger]RDH18112.1 hypothetical protein M747DRAFT_297525 [Aspergillus niger ATCC 13496]KAI2824391.1 hypothetical protein CBS115989_802 [Aspergillus niger]KAI2838444.1 hypothetical protein CBS11232_9609 [Aspergillus niger]KAI2868757.1 hypothetical protein CBS115988_10483 [Aspergillus niger]CAK44823.1 hypothetical protein An05g00030 [Aspergillus niger]